AALTPSVDLLFSDVWTDPDVRAPDPALELRYTALTTPPPTTSACLAAWSADCRIVINYEAHIHPLWTAVRQTLADDGVTVMSDHTCAQAGCHSSVDAMAATAVPAAQLDLADGL